MINKEDYIKFAELRKKLEREIGIAFENKFGKMVCIYDIRPFIDGSVVVAATFVGEHKKQSMMTSIEEIKKYQNK